MFLSLNWIVSSVLAVQKLAVRQNNLLIFNNNQNRKDGLFMKTNYIEGQLCINDVVDEKRMGNIYHTMIKERIEVYGTEALMPEEMLAVLTTIPLNKTRQLIEDYGLPELIKFIDSMNLTKVQQKKLQLLYLFSKTLSIASFKQKEILNSSNRAGEYFVKQLQFLRNEVFVIALLDSQNRLISFQSIFEGTINECPVYPRLIVKAVLDKNANSIILGHNHPGGSINPSSADIDITKRIKEALRTISVSVADHIIVADDKFVSFAERGLL
jgi:DNA repair protein RadC